MASNLLIQRICVSNKLFRLTQLSSMANKCLRQSTTSSSATTTNDYFEKNKSLKRPLSPVLIYKPQLTTVLSISHRMTGLSLAVLLYGGGISALYSQSTNFAQVLASVQASVPSSLLFTLKVLAGTSLVYHTFNGLRHLAWDFGYGFGLKELYTSGYIVLGVTLLAAIGFIMAYN